VLVELGPERPRQIAENAGLAVAPRARRGIGSVVKFALGASQKARFG
jgi:hypothetical protein